MADSNEEPIERPATWANVLVGKAKEILGHLTGDRRLTEEGAEQEQVAHEVREEYHEEHQQEHQSEHRQEDRD
ncbi:MAG: hypothetical protein EPN43_01760 [Jatrophihabitans sp.]|nr:MAG: hypothetical protein EPN43_01760 [Jatrophihabitans sp.]